MSDALNYLVKTRPDALGPYLAFLKACGTRLDPKTRNLISVITKVHAQTERGLRQYLLRALREGASAAEVLDALLMAFPALGLSKIVWAVDVILAMDLPEFQAGAMRADAGTWHDVLAVKEVAVGATKRVDGLGQPLPAPDDQHPGPGAAGCDADLPETRLAFRHRQRRLHRYRQRAAARLALQGREGAVVGALVSA
jgi:alkylhydroperoxidase/carboxymuconolactone decarboxylase family protein YurZ